MRIAGEELNMLTIDLEKLATYQMGKEKGLEQGLEKGLKKGLEHGREPPTAEFRIKLSSFSNKSSHGEAIHP